MDPLLCNMVSGFIDIWPPSHHARVGGLLLQQYMCRTASQHRSLYRLKLFHRDLHRCQFYNIRTHSHRSSSNLQSQLVKLQTICLEQPTSYTAIQKRHGSGSSTVAYRRLRLPVLVPHLCHGSDGSQRLRHHEFCLRLDSCGGVAGEFFYKPTLVYTEACVDG